MSRKQQLLGATILVLLLIVVALLINQNQNDIENGDTTITPTEIVTITPLPRNRGTPPLTPTITNGSGQTQGWQTVTSNTLNLSIMHPPAAEVSQNQQDGSLRISVLGEEQEQQTELTDGLILTFNAFQPQNNQSLQQFVNERRTEIQNQEITEGVSSVSSTNVGSHSGFTFTVNGEMGISRYYFISPNSQVIEIVEIIRPSNNSNYLQISTNILNSIEAL
jgi:hypothetical protein